jgi:fructose-1,6-bisphosphatase/inositol monophosphatase family enzyme
MRDEVLLEVLHDAASAVRAALDGLADWGDAGTRPGQYLSDLAADEAALAVLESAGLGALSEESGLHGADREVIVVLDPVDGSTNASRGLPWYATSLCAVDADGARASLVVDQASGARFEALRGGGSRVDGRPLQPSGCTELGDAVVGLSGYPPRWFGWKQFRALGAVALDLCAVAGGRLDAYVRPLVTLEHSARCTPVAAATPALLDQCTAARRRFAEHHPAWAAEAEEAARILGR